MQNTPCQCWWAHQCIIYRYMSLSSKHHRWTAAGFFTGSTVCSSLCTLLLAGTIPSFKLAGPHQRPPPAQSQCQSSLSKQQLQQTAGQCSLDASVAAAIGQRHQPVSPQQQRDVQSGAGVGRAAIAGSLPAATGKHQARQPPYAKHELSNMGTHGQPGGTTQRTSSANPMYEQTQHLTTIMVSRTP